MSKYPMTKEYPRSNVECECSLASSFFGHCSYRVLPGNGVAVSRTEAGITPRSRLNCDVDGGAEGNSGGGAESNEDGGSLICGMFGTDGSPGIGIGIGIGAADGTPSTLVPGEAGG